MKLPIKCHFAKLIYLLIYLDLYTSRVTSKAFSDSCPRCSSLALTPHDTFTLDETESVPFVITYITALRSIWSIIRKHCHVLISFPRCYNVFKTTPIVTYRRSSNLSDFQFRPNFAISHNITSPGAHTHAEKTVSLANTYLTDKLHTHSTLQAKPDLSLQKRH